MAKGFEYPQNSGKASESQPVAGGSGSLIKPWMLAAAFALFVGVAMLLVAGPLTIAVLQTWCYVGIAVPLILSAGMLGVALTTPIAGRGIFDDSPWPDLYRAVMSMALGLGAYGLGILALGAVHVLNPPWVPAILLVAGAAVGWAPTRSFFRSFRRAADHEGPASRLWFVLFGAVPLAIALIACTFPPSSLWSSEAHGYDVLEYHLEMPREYAQSNAIMPVSHNVYSYLPANVEMLYLSLIQMGKFVMSDDSSLAHLWGVFPSQFLHLLFMLLTVMGIGLAPLRMGRFGRAVAMVTVLAVPWTIVTASLAYDEWGMMLFGSLALGLALRDRDGRPAQWRAEGLLIGTLLGLAVGSKLTAGIAFAVPVAIVLMMRGQWRTLLPAILAAAVVFSPWAFRAAIASGGNPVFPIAAGTLGHADWTPEQVERFAHGHSALPEEQTFAARITSLLHASVLDQQWSPGWSSIYRWAGERPQARPVWWKYVGIFWIVAPIGLILALLGENRKAAAILLVILVVQVAGWLFLTHLQSRFLLPTIVSLAILMGLGSEGGPRGNWLAGVFQVLLYTVIGGQALCAIFLLLPEARLLAGVQPIDGRQPHSPIGDLFARSVSISAMVEPHPESEDISAGKTLLEGSAIPLFWGGDVRYNTAFDRNPLGDALRRGGPSGAAKWLRDEGFNYVVIDWGEIRRLRDTYGFDDAITPEAIDDLVNSGIRRAPNISLPDATVLQVRPVRASTAESRG